MLDKLNSNSTFFCEQSIAEDDDWLVEINGGIVDSDIFRTGMRVLRKRGHILLAICLNNGYYKRRRIAKLIQVAASLSDQVTIFFTDGPAKHNYLALGQSERQAIKQTRKQYNQLKNACDEAILRVANDHTKFTFINWNDVYSRDDYIATYNDLALLYNSNQQFKSDVRDATREVLRRTHSHSDIEAAVDVGIKYSLEELALLAMYEDIAAGLPSPAPRDSDFAYIYYMRWEILEKLVSGIYDGRQRNHIGCVVLHVSEKQSGAALSNTISPQRCEHQAN